MKSLGYFLIKNIFPIKKKKYIYKKLSKRNSSFHIFLACQLPFSNSIQPRTYFQNPAASHQPKSVPEKGKARYRSFPLDLWWFTCVPLRAPELQTLERSSTQHNPEGFGHEDCEGDFFQTISPAYPVSTSVFRHRTGLGWPEEPAQIDKTDTHVKGGQENSRCSQRRTAP